MPVRAVEDHVELREIVDAFLSNESAKSIVETYGEIEMWNVSAVKDFSRLFDIQRNPLSQFFESDLGAWDVSNGVDFSAMFHGTANFNADLSSWDVTGATNFSYTFANASAFNQDLSSWSVRSAITMEGMFAGATKFSQNLCTWRNSLSHQAVLNDAFQGTSCPRTSAGSEASGLSTSQLCFDCEQPEEEDSLTKICFNSTKELYAAVDNYTLDPSGGLTASTYGHPIGSWCVSKVETFNFVFSESRNPAMQFFNEDIGSWDVSGATSMYAMFLGARQFNQNLDRWNVSGVEDFTGTFLNCTLFNGNVTTWDTSAAKSMHYMFMYASQFQQDIGGWDVSKVENFKGMFWSAVRFNADLSKWNTGSATTFEGMLYVSFHFVSFRLCKYAMGSSRLRS